MGGEDLDWIPATCPNGHELGPGRLSLSWVSCDCPRAQLSRGHHVVYCRTLGCHARTLPPGCTGVKDQR